jgi:hypothetical protein
LTADHVILIEETGNVRKGALSGSAPPYTLSITIDEPGSYDVTVRIKKEGIVSDPNSEPFTVTKASPGIGWTVGDDGKGDFKSSTTITFIFEEELTTLNDDEVILTGLEDTGAERGVLDGSGKTWWVPITGITTAGEVSVTINKTGIVTGPKLVTLHKDTTAPGAVDDLAGFTKDAEGNGSATAITLTWDGPEDVYKDIDHFEVSYLPDGEEDWIKVKDTVALGAKKTTVTGIEPKTTYKFRVTTVDGDGNRSDPPAETEGTTLGEPAVEVTLSPEYVGPTEGDFTLELSGVTEGATLYWIEKTPFKVTVTGGGEGWTYRWVKDGEFLAGENSATLSLVSSDFQPKPSKKNTIKAFVTYGGVTYTKSLTFTVEVKKPE